MPSVNWKVNARATEARCGDSENSVGLFGPQNGEVFLNT